MYFFMFALMRKLSKSHQNVGATWINQWGLISWELPCVHYKTDLDQNNYQCMCTNGSHIVLHSLETVVLKMLYYVSDQTICLWHIWVVFLNVKQINSCGAFLYLIQLK